MGLAVGECIEMLYTGSMGTFRTAYGIAFCGAHEQLHLEIMREV